MKSKSISSRYAACMSEADGKGITLFGMDDNRCWIGENTDSTYSKYGTSGLCKKTKKGLYYGLSEHDTMRVYMKDVQGNYLGRFMSEHWLICFSSPSRFTTCHAN